MNQEIHCKVKNLIAAEMVQSINLGLVYGGRLKHYWQRCHLQSPPDSECVISRLTVGNILLVNFTKMLVSFQL